jgi:two-component system alkaline phosphatase synthesis response regulator PhoP
VPKVLIADDEASIANVVARKLGRAGLNVVVAMDGQEAYELALSERPDCLVTDLQMPGMTGLEVCARLKDEMTEPVPVILLTAKGFELAPEEVDGLPVRQVMTKPFSPRELLACVQDVLGVAAK